MTDPRAIHALCGRMALLGVLLVGAVTWMAAQGDGKAQNAVADSPTSGETAGESQYVGSETSRQGLPRRSIQEL